MVADDERALRRELLEWVRTRVRAGVAVTLVGHGGMGKTWLARRVEPDRAAFVDCVPANTASDLVRLLADALDRPTTASVEVVLTQLSGELARSGRLVVLDNLEQCLEPARTVVGALAEAGARVLCTSRAPLGIPLEEPCHVEGLERADATAFFLAHADRTTVHPANQAAAIDQLMELLDGNPLAIEIAAGNTRLASPEQLVAVLARSRDLVALDARADHHRSLGAVAARTWELLGPSERVGLRLLALLEGSWTLEVALELGVEVTALEGLRRWSLVQRVEAVPEVRMQIPAVLRGWVLGIQPPSVDERSQVVSWATRVARAAYEASSRSGEPVARARLASVYPNLERAAADPQLPTATRAEALTWAAAHLLHQHCRATLELLERHRDLRPEPEDLRVRLVLHRARALRRSGRQDEGLIAVDRALSESWSAEAEAELRSERVFQLSTGRHRSETLPEALRAVALVDGTDSDALALALRQLGMAYRLTHADPELSRAALERAIDLSQRRGLVINEVTAISHLMQLDMLFDREATEALYQRGLGTAERAGAAAAAVMLHGQYATRLLWDCDLPGAQRVVPLAVSGLIAMGQSVPADNLRCRLALVEAGHQEPGAGRTALEALLAECRRSQVSSYEPDLIAALGVMDHLQGELDRALERYAAAEARAVELDRRHARVQAVRLRQMALAELNRGKPGGSTDPMVLAVEAAWRGEVALDALEAQLPTLDGGHLQALLTRIALRPIEDRQSWTFQEDGRAFALPSGTRIPLGRRQAARRILVALVDARVGAPGTSIAAVDLIERGWPGERIRHDSAQARLWTAIRDLRSLGLESLLQTSGDGYRLDPGAPVQRVSELRASG